LLLLKVKKKNATKQKNQLLSYPGFILMKMLTTQHLRHEPCKTSCCNVFDIWAILSVQCTICYMIWI